MLYNYSHRKTFAGHRGLMGLQGLPGAPGADGHKGMIHNMYTVYY